jgi:hypothetical protein
MIKYIFVFILSINLAHADCEFSTGIKPNPDGSYTYSKECHLQVGKNFKELSLLKDENKQLRKTIELRDLALVKQEERVQLWMDTTYKLEDRINTMDRIRETNKFLYILMGVGITALSVYGAGQLR